MPQVGTKLTYYYKNGRYYESVAVERNLADSYDTSHSYTEGDMVDYLGNLYVCSVTTSGTFDPTKWSQVKLANAVTALQGTVEAITDTVPAAAGTYNLQAVVDAQGNTTFSWVIDNNAKLS